MIIFNYDPIIGCTGWDITRPEREPLPVEEVASLVKAWAEKPKKKVTKIQMARALMVGTPRQKNQQWNEYLKTLK
jgi:hypothetical protein